MSSTARKGSVHEQLRPAWTPINIAIMVVAFIIGAWPVGLFMIAYMIWGQAWGLDFSTWGKSDGVSRTGEKMKSAFGNAFDGKASSSRTGNSAFDEWRDAEMRRIEEERQKLETAKREFQEYMEEMQKARDKEEFERFKSRWDNNATGQDTPSGQ